MSLSVNVGEVIEDIMTLLQREELWKEKPYLILSERKKILRKR